MYEAFWQLETKPFDEASSAEFYYSSPSHKGALLKLRYAVEGRKPAALLCGAAGLGKTRLTERLCDLLPPDFAPIVRVVFPQMTSAELVAFIAHELSGGALDSATGLDGHIRSLREAIRANVARSQHALIIVDEAHLLANTEMLRTLRLLLNFESEASPGVTMLLIGQPDLLPALDRSPALEQRLSVKCLLRPFTIDDTIAYVHHRLTAAGGQPEIFAEEALGTLHTLARGNPRQINRLCDLALLVAYSEDDHTVRAEHLEAVSHELVTVAPE